MTMETGTNRPDWDLDQKDPVMANQLRTQLAEVKDFELDLNVIQLGLIRNVTVDDEHATIDMILTSPFCPYGQVMIDMVNEKAAQALGRPVVVEMGVEMWDFSMTEKGLLDDWGLF